MNDLFLKALNCQNKDRAPIWVMRQAGRYMPEYRAIRQKNSFLDMCHTPELAAEVTMLPLRAFGMDAAILFSDILIILEAFGLKFEIVEGIGPVMERYLETPADVHAISKVEMLRLDCVAKAIKLLRTELKVPLIGFCGAPFTLASYLIEKERSRELKKTKRWMLQDPKSFHLLLQKLTEATILYLKLQIKAGVQAIQIFDSWAHVLGHAQFREFSLAYLSQIIEGVKAEGVPIILFCRGSSIFASQLSAIGPQGISLDWQSDITQMRPAICSSIALQGNLDPDILYCDRVTIAKEAQRILKGMQGDPGFIFNLGHGVPPDVPADAMKVLVECVQNFRAPYAN